jgi:hypothetical protein
LRRHCLPRHCLRRRCLRRDPAFRLGCARAFALLCFVCCCPPLARFVPLGRPYHHLALRHSSTHVRFQDYLVHRPAGCAFTRTSQCLTLVSKPPSRRASIYSHPQCVRVPLRAHSNVVRFPELRASQNMRVPCRVFADTCEGRQLRQPPRASHPAPAAGDARRCRPVACRPVRATRHLAASSFWPCMVLCAHLPGAMLCGIACCGICNHSHCCVCIQGALPFAALFRFLSLVSTCPGQGCAAPCSVGDIAPAGQLKARSQLAGIRHV